MMESSYFFKNHMKAMKELSSSKPILLSRLSCLFEDTFSDTGDLSIQ